MTSINKAWYVLSLIAIVLIIFLPTILGHAVGFPMLCFMLGVSTTIVGVLIFNSIRQKAFTNTKMVSILVFLIIGLLFYFLVKNSII